MIDVDYGNIEEEQLDNETISILYEETAGMARHIKVW